MGKSVFKLSWHCLNGCKLDQFCGCFNSGWPVPMGWTAAVLYGIIPTGLKTSMLISSWKVKLLSILFCDCFCTLGGIKPVSIQLLMGTISNVFPTTGGWGQSRPMFLQIRIANLRIFFYWQHANFVLTTKLFPDVFLLTYVLRNINVTLLPDPV